MDIEKLRKAAQCQVVEKDVLGQTIRFKKLSLAERDQYAASSLSDEGKVTPQTMIGHQARLIALCVVDEKGKHPLSSEEVGSWSQDAVTQLYEVCAELNGLRAEAVEDAAKNS